MIAESPSKFCRWLAVITIAALLLRAVDGNGNIDVWRVAHGISDIVLSATVGGSQ